MSENEDKVPLRNKTEVEIVGIKDFSTPYRRIFKTIGLGTPGALFSFFATVQTNTKRMKREELSKLNKEIQEAVPRLEGAPPSVIEGEDPNAGLDIVEVVEDIEGEVSPKDLDQGKLIIGDDTIAAYDAGFNVHVAVREGEFITVYNMQDIFLTAVDDLRLQFAHIVTPKGKTDFKSAKAGTLSALRALLGFGYRISAGLHNGDLAVRVGNTIGTEAVLPLNNIVGLLLNMYEVDPSMVADPEWVFYHICKVADATANSRKQVQA